MQNKRQLITLLANPPNSSKARKAALKSLTRDIEKALQEGSRLSGRDLKQSSSSRIEALVQNAWAGTAARKKLSAEQAIRCYSAAIEIQKAVHILSALRAKATAAVAAARQARASNKSIGSALRAVAAAYRTSGATLEERFALSTQIARQMKQITAPGKDASVSRMSAPAPWGEFVVRLSDPPGDKRTQDRLSKLGNLVLRPYGDVLDERLHPAMREEGQKKRKEDKKK